MSPVEIFAVVVSCMSFALAAHASVENERLRREIKSYVDQSNQKTVSASVAAVTRQVKNSAQVLR